MSNEYKCEAALGVDTVGSDIVIRKCHKPAKLRKIKGFYFEVAFCEGCMTAWRKKNESI